MYNFGGTMVCDSVLNCFRYHFDFGLINAPTFEAEGPVPVDAIWFNFTYILLINMIIASIISGIIIDTFGELRSS